MAAGYRFEAGPFSARAASSKRWSSRLFSPSLPSSSLTSGFDEVPLCRQPLVEVGHVVVFRTDPCHTWRAYRGARCGCAFRLARARQPAVAT